MLSKESSNPPKVSIVIVHYKNSEILNGCINSIYKYSKKFPFEVIVVDNSEKLSRKISPKVKYIKSPGNIGYAAGNNLGVKHSKSDNIFILNPDTLFVEDILGSLVRLLRSDKKIGIVAPILVDKSHKKYLQIGIKMLTPLRAIVVLSFINKLFPNNSISKAYWGKNINFKRPVDVDIVAGSAFMIKKEIFTKIGGFDENFFLYFEEVDLCKRVLALGYKITLYPKIKILHYWAATTPKSKRIKKIFEESRFYYFKKHFGIINAVIVELFAKASIRNIMS